MIGFLLAAPTWLGIIVSMVLATAVGLSIYGISHKLIARYESGALKDPTRGFPRRWNSSRLFST